MLAQFSITPIGKGARVGEYVAQILKLVDERGLDYQLTAMSTIVEGEWDEVMQLIKDCHHLMRNFAERVLTTIIIDDFTGRTGRLKGKVEDVEELLGKKLKT